MEQKRFTKNEYLRMSEEACGMLEIRNEKKMDKKRRKRRCPAEQKKNGSLA